MHGDFRLSKITFKGLQALYYHYLYLLRKARRHLQERVNELISERTVLNNRLRRSPRDEHAEEWRTERNSLTAEITKLREQFKTAGGIETRSEEIAGKLRSLERSSENRGKSHEQRIADVRR